MKTYVTASASNDTASGSCPITPADDGHFTLYVRAVDKYNTQSNVISHTWLTDANCAECTITTPTFATSANAATSGAALDIDYNCTDLVAGVRATDFECVLS